MADKKDSINPTVTKEVDYMDPELATKKAKKSLKDTAKDVKFWTKQGKKLLSALKPVLTALLAILKFLFLTPPGWIILLIILVIGFWLGMSMMPGLMQAKLRTFFKNLKDKTQGWFMTTASAQLDDMDYSDIVNIANYLEEMGYDLIGDGFVYPETDTISQYKTFDELLETEGYTYDLGEDNEWHLFQNGNLWDGIYYNTLGIAIDNKTNEKITNGGITYTDKYGIVRSTTEQNSKGEGKLVYNTTIEIDPSLLIGNTVVTNNINKNNDTKKQKNSITKDNLKNYRMLRTYLLSDYRIFTLRNNDQENILKTVYSNIKKIFGSYQDAWSRGLVKVYNAEEGIAKDAWGFIDGITGDRVKIDRDSITLRNGYTNNPMIFKTAGWAPRYGLSLDFLLSLHLGTMAPDLVYAMVQNFDTEIQVYLEDSGKSRVDSKYLDPGDESNEDITLGDVEQALRSGNTVWSNISASLEGSLGDGHLTQDWVNALILTKKNCMLVLKNTALVSPDNCTSGVTDYDIGYVSDSETSSYYEDIDGTDDTNKNILKNKYNYTDSSLESIDLEYYEKAGESKHYNPATMLQSVKYSSKYNSATSGSTENDRDPKQSDLDEALNKAFEDRQKSHDALKEAKIDIDDNLLVSTYDNNIQTVDNNNSNIKYRIEKSAESYVGIAYGWFDESTGKWNYGNEAQYNANYGGHEWEDIEVEYYSYIYKVYKTITGDNNSTTSKDNSENTGRILRGELTILYSDNIKPGSSSVESPLYPAKGTSHLIRIYENTDGTYTLTSLKNGETTENTTTCKHFKDEKIGASTVYEWTFLPPGVDEKWRQSDTVALHIKINKDSPTFVSTNMDVIADYINTSESTANIPKENMLLTESEKNETNQDGGIVLNQEYQIDVLYATVFVRDRSMKELQYYGVMDEEGNRTTDYKCSQSPDEVTICCSNCQRYVKKVVNALADISDQNYKMYTPYIARVVGSWFRDTYFIVPEKNSGDIAIHEYQYSYGKKVDGEDDEKHEKRPEFDRKTAEGDTVQFVKVDEEYLSDTGEYWTSYEMKDDNQEEYQLYYLNSDGTTSNETLEEFLEKEHEYIDNDGNKVTKKFVNQKEAEDAGFAFVKKAEVYNIKDFAENHSPNMQNPDNGLGDKILWSAYSFSVTESTDNWTRVDYGESNPVDRLYEVFWTYDEEGNSDDEDKSKGIFYRLTTTNQVTQEEDAQRGQTNALIKYLFKYRRYYIYDGTRETALRIQKDREKVLEQVKNKTIVNKNGKACIGIGVDGDERKRAIENIRKYGRSALRDAYSGLTIESTVDEDDLAEQWLEWQLDMFYMQKYGVNLDNYYGTNNLLKLEVDPRDPNLINTVNITKSSLNAFTILENSGTIDAEYQYRDFKELIVELNYFDKEDLSEKPDSVFTWILPETSPMGWPNRIWDKQDVEYGALVQSKDTYSSISNGSLTIPTENEEESDNSEDGEENTNSPNEEPVTGDTPNVGEEVNPSTNDTNNPAQNNSQISSSIDETKIVFIGDSWTEGLSSYSIPKSSYVYGRVGKNADDFISSPVTIPDDASAIVIEFGLNDPSGATKTLELAKKFITENQNLPIFVVAAPHVSNNYSGIMGSADEFNAKLDEYNKKLKDSCNTENKITYIDPTSSILENGYLKYPSGESDSGTFHMSSEGYKIWYEAIVGEINSNSSANGNVTTGKATFEGWEAEQLVVSPITGKVLEYGTHTRMNVYTGKEEKVGYIVLEALTEGSNTNGSGNKTGYFTNQMVSSAEYNPQEDTGYTAAEALNLFYKEYDTNCAGYTIMIDGFNVDIQTVDSQDNVGTYEQNEVVALYNSEEQKKREKMEQAKQDAPFFINNGESSIPTMEEGYHAQDSFTGLYVKEGKYIGKTMEPSSIETYDTITPESVISKYEGPADYIRIVMKDLDYSVVENVEDFFDIPEPETGGGTTSGVGIFGDLEEITENSTDAEKVRAAVSYFVSQGITVEGACGIVGNLIAETNLNPALGENKSATGLVQWMGARKAKVIDWMQSQGYNWDSFAGQIRAIVELEGDATLSGDSDAAKAIELVRNETNVEKAAEAFMVYSERCVLVQGKTNPKYCSATEYYKPGKQYQLCTDRKIFAQNAYKIYMGDDSVGLKDGTVGH